MAVRIAVALSSEGIGKGLGKGQVMDNNGKRPAQELCADARHVSYGGLEAQVCTSKTGGKYLQCGNGIKEPAGPATRLTTSLVSRTTMPATCNWLRAKILRILARMVCLSILL